MRRILWKNADFSGLLFRTSYFKFKEEVSVRLLIFNTYDYPKSSAILGLKFCVCSRRRADKYWLAVNEPKCQIVLKWYCGGGGDRSGYRNSDQLQVRPVGIGQERAAGSSSNQLSHFVCTMIGLWLTWCSAHGHSVIFLCLGCGRYLVSKHV